MNSEQCELDSVLRSEIGLNKLQFNKKSIIDSDVNDIFHVQETQMSLTRHLLMYNNEPSGKTQRSFCI